MQRCVTKLSYREDSPHIEKSFQKPPKPILALPIFPRVMLNLLNVGGPRPEAVHLPGLDLVPLDLGDPGAKLDLTLYASETPRGIDGVSMLPALLGKKGNDRRFLYWEFHEGGFVQAVRMDNWKAVRRSFDGPFELYDLKNDIGERNNVAFKNLDIVKAIESYLQHARTDSELWPVKKDR